MKQNSTFPHFFQISELVQQCIIDHTPLVALETTVITHGLPDPKNIELAQNLINIIHENAAVPAFVGILDGQVIIGMSMNEIIQLVHQPLLRKVSTKDIGPCRIIKSSGGTTVSATMALSYQSGIRIFSTGGIGGVHRGNLWDVSNDLHQLSRTPMIVVCAGPKAILDIPATKEYLETMGVPVVGFNTDQIPSFYLKNSGISVDVTARSTEEIAAIAKAHWQNINKTAVLVVVPPPVEINLSRDELEKKIQSLIDEAERKHIIGGELTPYILGELNKVTNGESVEVNIRLLCENARIAAAIASDLTN